jgi:hypothetical protein
MLLLVLLAWQHPTELGAGVGELLKLLAVDRGRHQLSRSTLLKTSRTAFAASGIVIGAPERRGPTDARSSSSNVI